MAGHPNVVLVVMDTARALDAYDSTVAPTVADIGAAGTTATQAISAAPWTLPSHASMMTGMMPSKHGAHADHERLEQSVPRLPEFFQAAGYETVCCSNNTWVSIEAGFDRGFETFRQMWQFVQSNNALSELVDVTDESRKAAIARRLFDGNPLSNAANVLYRKVLERRADDGAERSTRWLQHWLDNRNSGRPFFLLVNYLEPHLEYRPPRRLAREFLPAEWTYDEAMAIPQDPWRYLAGQVTLDADEFDTLRALYRAEIAYVDEQIGALKASLADADEWEETVFVVTADHGENIGDHGMMDHQYCLYDTLVHVPLVLQGGAFRDGEDLTAPVSLVDLAPTLLEAATIEVDADVRDGFQGQSFLPGSSNSPREFTVSEYMAPQPSLDALERHVGALPANLYQYDRSLRAVRTPEYKFIRGSDGTTELYDLQENPEETDDVARKLPREFSRLETMLDEWLETFDQAAHDREVRIDGARKRQLEELGYLQ